MKYVIDRIEGEYAVLEIERGVFANIEVRLLPQEAKEGDVVCISIDDDKTHQRDSRIEEKANDLFI